MKGALGGRPSVPFEAPEGVVFADIDPDTGQLATPNCPRTFSESFIAGTVPTQTCERHRGPLAGRILNAVKGLFTLGRD